jgi:hypothetical protein
MTTHETQPEMVDPADERGGTAEPMTAQPAERVADTPLETVDATGNLEPPVERAEPPVESAEPSVETADSTASAASADQMLFAANELSDLRSRWTDVQSAFVDDPRDCVRKADGLVADVVDQLTSSFAHARSYLEEQWDRGEQVSTEDLRIALTRYREFFERLLAV